MDTLSNVLTPGENQSPTNIGVAPGVIPEAISSTTGVSVEYVHDETKKWFAFRASYGRVLRAADYIIGDGTYAYVAKRFTWKQRNGKRKKELELLIPNILFVYTTPQQAEQYVKLTPALSFLHFYYDHLQEDSQRKNPPATIPVAEMDNFILATCNMSEYLRFVNAENVHYKSGDEVEVIDGMFSGVRGRVARVAGQQRVIVSLSQLGLIATAYIPTAFLRPVKQSK